MLSKTKASTNKSTQDEVRSESKNTTIITNLAHTTISSECSETSKSCEMKIERKDLKETEKQKEIQLQDESLTDSKREYSRSKLVESENIEIKVENIQTEDRRSITLDETLTPQRKMFPITGFCTQNPTNVAVPRKYSPLPTPLLGERPIVLATHLVPSLPISLFEVLVEAIEVAIEKPVVLLHEPRNNRPVAKEVTDIAILPASNDWKDGELLPASFCFEHNLNKNNSPCVYADVIIAADCASHIEGITDLRGRRCSLPDRKKKVGVAALLFNYLYMKGEGPAFFGNTLDTDTHVASLQMVAGKQAEMAIIESPIIACHKNILPGINALQVLTSLGPLPPYRIMVKKTLPDILKRKIAAYLLNIGQDAEWREKLAPYGVTGFTRNSETFYELDDIKNVATSAPYY
ncbi:uncharacterized protein LOC143432733 [Xylocopa sonorina]|uniref:uncharacterized protein LOC143432733 n=1 Tax=Xylocopa sonorina TaxID=1818115 RepID=UPI00403B19F3